MSKRLKTWLIEPRDTLMVRDGRPAGDGLSMRSLPFPWPSTVTGLARTRAGSNADGLFTMSPEQAKKLIDVPVVGPWLAELDQDGAVKGPCFPAPADCLWHDETDGKLLRTRLKPKALGKDEASDLPNGFTPLFAENLPDGKPSKEAPAFWTWAEMKAWLHDPEEQKAKTAKFGIQALKSETRTHVGISGETGTADEGKLFSTEMIRFADKARRLALVFGCDSDKIKPGGVHLGGERRISWLSEGDSELWPETPTGITSDTLRVVLITPGIFDEGWRPKAFKDATLIAAAVGRPEVISGWDFAAQGPKPCRRMAPAGSVYWLKFKDSADANKWLKEHWMTCISDNKQDQRDGFGLCLVGVG